MKSKSHYDKIWNKKASRIFRASFLKKELDLFKENKVKTVLDLGFGNGDNLCKLASSGFKVSGLEFSVVGVKVAKDKFDKLGLKGNLIKGNFYTKLPYKNSQFDAVYAYQAICHNKIEEIRKTLKEIHRVLKKGGIFSIKDGVDRVFVKKGNFYCMAPKLRRKLKLIASDTYLPMLPNDPEKGVIHYEFTMKSFVEEITNAGFELINKRRLKKGTMGLLNFRKI